MAREQEDADGREEEKDMNGVDDHHHDDEPALAQVQAQESRILDACRRRDIDDLQVLAVSRGGFLSDAIRRQACE